MLSSVLCRRPCQILMTPVLQNFIAVYETTGTFSALPALGLRTQTLCNPSLRQRAFCGRAGHHDGILVVGFASGSCARTAGVQNGDVLMAIDDCAVSEDGEIVFRGHERVHYSYAYTRKKVGDVVKLSLLRRACGEKDEILQAVDLEVTLDGGHHLVPRELGKDYQADYVIIGGIVLLVAGIPLSSQLEAKGKFGPRQQAVVSAEEGADEEDGGVAAGGGSLPSNSDENVQVVFVGDCLAHEVNVGYQMFMGHRLKTVNGAPARTLAQAAALVQKAVIENTPFICLGFAKTKATAVFETEALLAATPTILAQHRIHSWTSLLLELGPPQPPRPSP